MLSPTARSRACKADIGRGDREGGVGLAGRSAAGQHRHERPERLRPTRHPLRQANLPGPGYQLGGEPSQEDELNGDDIE